MRIAKTKHFHLSNDDLLALAFQCGLHFTEVGLELMERLEEAERERAERIDREAIPE